MHRSKPSHPLLVVALEQLVVLVQRSLRVSQWKRRGEGFRELVQVPLAHLHNINAGGCVGKVAVKRGEVRHVDGA